MHLKNSEQNENPVIASFFKKMATIYRGCDKCKGQVRQISNIEKREGK
jgi:hypothetical protein